MTNLAQQPADPLRLARHDIADRILRSFESKLIWSSTIFAPRRKGKTQFLQRDLIPMAKERGFLVAYTDLWSNKKNPEAVLILAMAEAIKDAGLITRLLAQLHSRPKLKSAKFAIKPGELSAEPAFQDESLPSFNQMFERFTRAAKGRAILVIDEVQHLASKTDFEDFTAALRSSLDRKRGEVFGLFTGSSQGGLTNLFGKTKAPFYQFASRLEFPDFGIEIAYHFGQHYQAITGKPWGGAEAYDLFCKRGRTPQYLRALFQRCVTHQENPHDADEVQNALKKLERPKYGIIGRTDFGEYTIEDDLLRTWLLENPGLLP